MNLTVAPDFAGVVSVRHGGEVVFEQAYGLADRAQEVPVRTDTQFATASATKGFTALVVVGLAADGVLPLDTTARSLLKDDLPLIADDVTVEHLLGHTSGIGDYLDEDLEEELPLKVPVQHLVDTEDYLPALDGFPTKFPAGERFAYCNGGYVVLALLAERAASTPFHELVAERVWRPAGMTDTAFLRSDELPGRAALGYLDDGRTNVFKLPVRGNGDGGAYSTCADFARFWTALFDGRIVPDEWVQRMVRPRTEVGDPGERVGYGLGFWSSAEGNPVYLQGADHGVSFRSLHDPKRDLTATVVSNTGGGAWTPARELRTEVFG